jgi:FtsZ-binding cell division protein ZapB
MLATLGFWISAQQNARQQRTQELENARQHQIEDLRAEAEQKIAEQRAQDEALQAYLDQMGTLLLERDLRNSGTDSEVRTLAQARTITTLGRVDTSHKEEIMQFLLEADLVPARITQQK